ncbi:hypothetical protein CERZMDRAFT_87995 [Cercospora zeae-maydis SCOH1-5]|uniref:Uncharacterized protein n=1 Tax=Cercospora zeae-maydis SCOH1-5 TaxID=717836 RepID=A0A6A6F6S2_9PEZI|nr:hypothetical protein CERZMDRAFT_87995 [Cercospora zeae-maydis SCOH1-5]
MNISESHGQHEADGTQDQASIWSSARTQAQNSRASSPKTHDEAFIFSRYTKHPKLSRRLDSVSNWAASLPMIEDFEDLRDRDSDYASSGPPSPLDLTRTTNREHRPRVGQPPQAEREGPSKRRTSSPRSPLSRVLSPPLGALTKMTAPRTSSRNAGLDGWVRALQDNPDSCNTPTPAPDAKDSAFSLPGPAKPHAESSQDAASSLSDRAFRMPEPPQECIDAIKARCSFPRREPRVSTVTTVETENVPGPGSASPNSRSSLTITPHSGAFDSMGEHIQGTYLTRATSLAKRVVLTVPTSPTEEAEHEQDHLDFRRRVLEDCGANCQTNTQMAALCPFCEHVNVRYNQADYLEVLNGMIQQAREAEQRENAFGALDRFHVWIYVSCGVLSTMLTYCLVMYSMWADDPRALWVCLPLMPIQYMCFMAFFETGPGRESFNAEREPLLSQGWRYRSRRRTTHARILSPMWCEMNGTFVSSRTHFTPASYPLRNTSDHHPLNMQDEDIPKMRSLRPPPNDADASRVSKWVLDQASGLQAAKSTHSVILERRCAVALHDARRHWSCDVGLNLYQTDTIFTTLV